MKSPNYPLLLLFLVFLCCNTQNKEEISFNADDLKIEQLTGNTFIHTLYFKTEAFGKVACNGMIIIDNNEAIIYDISVNNSTSRKLIHCVETELNAKVKAVVVSHFHIDCLGGLKAFHDKSIPSFANNLTIELAKITSKVIPQNSFDSYFEHLVGNKKI